MINFDSVTAVQQNLWTDFGVNREHSERPLRIAEEKLDQVIVRY